MLSQDVFLHVDTFATTGQTQREMYFPDEIQPELQVTFSFWVTAAVKCRLVI